jgi:KamA family protein
VRATAGSPRPRFRALGLETLDELVRAFGIPAATVREMRAVATVYPFRANEYVVESLIDWRAVPDDPIFQLVFPQPGMLEERDLTRMVEALNRSGAEATAIADEIRRAANPHPGLQLELNTPDGDPATGIQHKYTDTVLFFPSHGQTCHAYCTYCFRWAQFVGSPELRFASADVAGLVAYLRNHQEVTDVLLTGGDPLIMSSRRLRAYVEPLLEPSLEHVATIRIGTKALSYWPRRFLTDHDADDLLGLCEEVVAAGRRLAVMAHFAHPRELVTHAAEAAIARVRATGATIYCQAPIIRHVNADAATLAALWQAEHRHGCIPYYAFVERDTGPRHYFELPLHEARTLVTEAQRGLSGLLKTLHGPVMSASFGKVVLDGEAAIAGERVFVLRFLRARDPDWVGRPFFARWDADATWFDDLVPAAGTSDVYFRLPHASPPKALLPKCAGSVVA